MIAEKVATFGKGGNLKDKARKLPGRRGREYQGGAAALVPGNQAAAARAAARRVLPARAGMWQSPQT